MSSFTISSEDENWVEDHILFDDDNDNIDFLHRIARRERRSGHLVRGNLQPHPRLESAWQSLYKSDDERAFITTMSVDKVTFNYLLSAGFRRAWNNRTIPRNDVNAAGRTRLGRRSLAAEGALGLLLHHLCSTMNETGLQLIFAIVPSVLSRYINFGLDILLQVLRQIPEATISWPTPEEMQTYSEAINQRHPTIHGAFGFMDGLGVPVGVSGDPLVENANYNGWKKCHKVTSVIAFAPDGTIIATRMNAPGSWHDSRVARPIYELLLDQTPPGFYLLADTAFPHLGRGENQKIHTPLKQGAKLRGLTRAQKLERLERSNDVTSARQAAEWGMRAIQGAFARLRVPLDANDAVCRARLLEVCFRLHNVRTRMVGINQIQTVYMPAWTGGQPDFFERLNAMLFPPTRQINRARTYHLELVD
ncbi:hypothetical protein BDV93DRAFT_580586 [Ceratobasidium sp. AG-I]|nr:hypothetical protein BDV93DRAFT_580586 [Ceratobasidium sp. AG-I]